MNVKGGVHLISGELTQHKLYHDPYVQLLLKHLQDTTLFRGTPDSTRKRQQSLLIPFLEFFLRHDRENYYAHLFRRKGLLEESAAGVQIKKDVQLKDLVRLRIHSDDLRENGQNNCLIRSIDLNQNHKVFLSSGTTQNTKGPVKILRTPLTIQLGHMLNEGLNNWSLGGKFRTGLTLLQMAPEMKDSMWFAYLGTRVMEQRGCEVMFGARIRQDPEETNLWRKLEPDKKTLHHFFTSKSAPKYFITSGIGLYHLLLKPNKFQHFLYRYALGIPPIQLGDGGVLMTGGGLKRVPSEYQTMQDLMASATHNILAGGNRAPIVDILGLTESMSVFLNRAADPLNEDAWVKYPHPLTYVALVESPQNLNLISNPASGMKGLLFYTNFACLDYLEAVLSGDFVRHASTANCPQHGFIYERRLKENEGFMIREGCG